MKSERCTFTVYGFLIMPVVMNESVLSISMFLGNAFTLSMPEASAVNVPLREFPPPRSLATGESCLIGDMAASLVPKKAVTSITTLLPFLAAILKPLSLGLRKFFLKADAMASLGSTVFLICTRSIYTLRSSLENCMSIGVLIICPATKS